MTGLGKQPLRRMEVHIHKFNDVAIPYHIDLLNKHKRNILKYQEDREWNKIYHEQINATRSVKQLKAILSELDILRSQVQESDLNKFDSVTTTSRESALNAVKDFLAIKPQQPYIQDSYLDSSSKVNGEDTIKFDDQEFKIKELQVKVAIDEKFKQEKCLKTWENLEVEVQEIHDLFEEFARVVHDQKELVEVIEDNVETTKSNIEAGTKSLRYASMLKASIYPFAGAIAGGCLGGPIGLIAGVKIGSLAALGGGLLGFTGGKILKKKREQYNNQEVEMLQMNNQVPENPSSEGKIHDS